MLISRCKLPLLYLADHTCLGLPHAWLCVPQGHICSSDYCATESTCLESDEPCQLFISSRRAQLVYLTVLTLLAFV